MMLCGVVWLLLHFGFLELVSGGADVYKITRNVDLNSVDRAAAVTQFTGLFEFFKRLPLSFLNTLGCPIY